MSDFESFLFSEFKPYASLSAQQLSVLQSHYLLMLKWNRRLNLTRITELREAVHFHYCESLYLALHLPPGAHTVADVGSGAGFPGFPIAVFRPECAVHLIESDLRKSVFLREVSRSVGNIHVIPGRAENVAEHFDWIVSRAVRPDTVLKLGNASNFAILGSQGERLPWGGDRSLLLRCST